MYIVRDIFRLKFGHYRDAKELLDHAFKKNLMPVASDSRVLTDFTGDSYRLIFEEAFESLAAYEQSLTSGMGDPAWKDWYADFKKHVDSSHREILKVVG